MKRDLALLLLRAVTADTAELEEGPNLRLDTVFSFGQVVARRHRQGRCQTEKEYEFSCALDHALAWTGSWRRGGDSSRSMESSPGSSRVSTPFYPE